MTPSFLGPRVSFYSPYLAGSLGWPIVSDHWSQYRLTIGIILLATTDIYTAPMFLFIYMKNCATACSTRPVAGQAPIRAATSQLHCNDCLITRCVTWVRRLLHIVCLFTSMRLWRPWPVISLGWESKCQQTATLASLPMWPKLIYDANKCSSPKVK